MLKKSNYEILTAYNGKQALETVIDYVTDP